MKPTAYISGPISKVPGGNKEAFKDAQQALEREGYEVLNPHEICSELRRSDFDTDKAFWNACMRACLKSMMDADVIVMLPGFTCSDGAEMELETAKRLDFKVIFFAEWYQQRTGLVFYPPKFTERP